jgi:enediyne polyketide synthase
VADPTATARAAPAPALAVVGLACRFPDADDGPELLDVVLTGRRSFRRIPPARLDIDDYFQPDRATSDATYSTRAALIEGWQFDYAAFGVRPATYAAADPALWLALETTARALAGAGLTAGSGLNRDRTGIILGNTLAGDISRANTMRVRWPYVRRVLTDALATEVPAPQAGAVLRQAERRYLAPFPIISPATRVGSTPGSMVAAISGYFGFRGGSHAIDSTCSSSLQAISSACSALAAGDLDAVIAGGVDVSLDPFELIGLAKAGALATDEVRIYDQHPTGYLPAEGCGMVVLMRTQDARAAGLPVYAEIVGWGTSTGGSNGEARTGVSSQLLAMRRAYERAGLDPAEVQFFEGNGAGTKEDDEAELIALEVLRASAREPAVLGSVKANIGHAKAAAGSAALIKTVLSLSTGVLPPATGVRTPHALINGGAAQLALPQVAREWPEGVRFAGVSTLDSGGSNVHLVLRSEPAAARPRHDRWSRPRTLPTRSLDGDGVTPRLMAAADEPLPFLLQASDRFALAQVLSRLADISRWLSDAELQDLACALGRDQSGPGTSRVALVAAGQEQLAARAREAAAMLPQLADGLLAVGPGIFAADGADGRISLLLSGEDADPAGNLTDSVRHCLDVLRWLESLDASAACAVGHGLGALAGLAWAGVLGEGDAREIAELRAQFLHAPVADDEAEIRLVTAKFPADRLDGAKSAAASGPRLGTPSAPGRTSALIGPAPAAPANTSVLRAAIAEKFRFGPPRRRLIATLTGAEVRSVDDAIDLICSGFSGADKLADAIAVGAVGATLLLETGPGATLTTVANQTTRVPAVSLGAGPSDPAARANIAAALFAAGALGQAHPLFAGWPARPIDVWRERAFITSPCETRPQSGAARSAEAVPAAAAVAALEAPEPTAEPAPTEVTGPATPAPASLPAASEPGSTEVTGQVTAEAASKLADGAAGLSGLRGKFERRPPDRPMVDAAAGPDHSSPQAARPADATPDTDQVPGLAPWTSCFGETLQPADRQPRPADKLPWRTHLAGHDWLQAAATRTFHPDSGATRTLAVLGDPADADSRAAALQAARDAIATGQLVVLTTSPGFTGFFAGLQAEHPELGVTVLRIPDSASGPSLAERFAYTDGGTFRELVLAADGRIFEPALSELQLTAGGAFPLGAEDVVLVSRGARGAGLALAQVLACCGTPVAVIGRATDGDDSELVAGLEQLRSAGARVGYEVIDIANPASLAAAIERIELRLGPVTAIGHAAGQGHHVPLAELTDIEISDHVANEAATLERLVASVRPGQLRLIVTFGSVAGRYGLAGESMLALASGALAGRAGQLARAADNCQSLHVDIPAWSTGGLGDRPELADEFAATGTAPIDLSAASRLLLKIMTTSGLPDRLAMHGRVSGPAARTARPLDTAELRAADLPSGGRFLRDVKVYYPGIELICEARLSLQSDPYLSDYRMDGQPVLPGVLALEALAEAASVLAGQPTRVARKVRMDLPIVIPAGAEAELRILAQRTGNTIATVLRCGDSSFAVDHVTAEFSSSGTQEDLPAATLGMSPSALPQLSASLSGLVDGAELYGPIAFQSGRFRRVALLQEVTTRSCRALARGTDEQPWFDPVGPFAGSGFVLGSPGLSDATLHALQACVPHRRVRPASCESVVFSGRAADGAVEIRAVAVPGLGSRERGAPTASGTASAGGEATVEYEAATELETAVGSGSWTGADLPAGSDPTAMAASAASSGRTARLVIGGDAEPEMTAEELADQQPVQTRPSLKRTRREQRRHAAERQRHAADQQKRQTDQQKRAAEQQKHAADRQRRATGANGASRRDPAPVPTQVPDQPMIAVPAQASRAGQERSGRRPAVAPRRRLADQLWDVEAVDSTGQLLLAWRGVRLRDAGPLPRNAAWPPSLLSVYLERGGCDLGLDAGLRVTVSCGQPDGPGPQFLAMAVPRQAPPGGQARSGARHSAGRAAASGAANVAVAAGTGPLAGFSLTATAAVPVACGWTTVEPSHRLDQPAGGMASAYSQLRSKLAESPATLAARLRAVGACLSMAGLPASESASCQQTTGDGWALLATATASIACAVVEVSGVASPVAIAIMTSRPSAGPAVRAALAPRAAEVKGVTVGVPASAGNPNLG